MVYDKSTRYNMKQYMCIDIDKGVFRYAIISEDLDIFEEKRVTISIDSKEDLLNFNFQKLSVLYLDDNKFERLNFLTSCCFPLLDKLYLTNNNIKDIQILKNCNFKK